MALSSCRTFEVELKLVCKCSGGVSCFILLEIVSFSVLYEAGQVHEIVVFSHFLALLMSNFITISLTNVVLIFWIFVYLVCGLRVSILFVIWACQKLVFLFVCLCV